MKCSLAVKSTQNFAASTSQKIFAWCRLSIKNSRNFIFQSIFLKIWLQITMFFMVNSQNLPEVLVFLEIADLKNSETQILSGFDRY